MKTITAPQRIFLTEDRKRAVAEGDKDAKYLFATQGQEVQEGDVEKYDGLADLLKEPKAKAKAEKEPEAHPTKAHAKGK